MKATIAMLFFVLIVMGFFAAIGIDGSTTNRTRIEAEAQRYAAQQQAEAQKFEAQQYAEAQRLESTEATKRTQIWSSTLPQLAMIIVVGVVLVALIWRSNSTAPSAQIVPMRVQAAMRHFEATDAILQDGQWLLLRDDRVVARQRLLTG